MVEIGFKELFQELSPRFDDVDVRFACFRHGAEWVNYASSIRFLSSGIPTAPKVPPIVTSLFRTFYSGGTVEDDWRDFEQAFANGKVQLQEDDVTLRPAVDVTSLNLSLSKQSTIFTEKQWPQYSAAINRRDPGPDQKTLSTASSDVRRLGYRDTLSSYRCRFTPRSIQ